jgi:hypothetical protein
MPHDAFLQCCVLDWFLQDLRAGPIRLNQFPKVMAKLVPAIHALVAEVP